jgi:translation elongation factor EF-Ts
LVILGNAILGRKLAAHVVGFSPDFVRIEDVPAEVMEKHKKDFFQRLEGILIFLGSVNK